MASKMEALKASVQQVLGAKLARADIALDELTIVCNASDLLEAATLLRDHEALAFEQCIDLCGVDFSTYKNEAWDGQRFAVVYQLLSVRHNRRLRLRVYAADDDFPVIPSVVPVWSATNWYERETFDLYGIVFDGHPDLRRLLTDYGFVGHPFRKDFPLSGHVEMRYDPEQQRVIYQPITIEPREITPRIVREENYGG